MTSSVKPSNEDRKNFSESQFATQLDTILSNVDAQLRALVSDDCFQEIREDFELLSSPSSSRLPSPALNVKVPFEIRLGRTRLTLEEVAKLDVDLIVPLLDSTNGLVQIWSNGRLCGTGVLLVASDKLAVKIVSFQP